MGKGKMRYAGEEFDSEAMRAHKILSMGPLYLDDLFEIEEIEVINKQGEAYDTIFVLKTKKVEVIEEIWSEMAQPEEVVFSGTSREACEKMAICMTQYINDIIHVTKELIARKRWWESERPEIHDD